MRDLNKDFDQYYGSLHWWVDSKYPNLSYTDGVKAVAEKYFAFGLIHYIFSLQAELKTKHKDPYQFWLLRVYEDHSELQLSDGNENITATYAFVSSEVRIPQGQLKIWLFDDVCLLPSEY